MRIDPPTTLGWDLEDAPLGRRCKSATWWSSGLVQKSGTQEAAPGPPRLQRAGWVK